MTRALKCAQVQTKKNERERGSKSTNRCAMSCHLGRLLVGKNREMRGVGKRSGSWRVKSVTESEECNVYRERASVRCDVAGSKYVTLWLVSMTCSDPVDGV